LIKMNYVGTVKERWLNHLYYDLNKQEDFQVQVQSQDNYFSKRQSYFDSFCCRDSDYSFRNAVNARTVLPCEICLDYDLNEDWTKYEVYQLFRQRLPNQQRLMVMYLGPGIEMYVWDTSSKGIHVHFFHPSLKFMDHKIRKHLRCIFTQNFTFKKISEDMRMIKLVPDRMKISEKCTIQCEFAKHWKTGKDMILLHKSVLGSSAQLWDLKITGLDIKEVDVFE
jgi:hypothetical protein